MALSFISLIPSGTPTLEVSLSFAHSVWLLSPIKPKDKNVLEKNMFFFSPKCNHERSEILTLNFPQFKEIDYTPPCHIPKLVSNKQVPLA